MLHPLLHSYKSSTSTLVRPLLWSRSITLAVLAGWPGVALASGHALSGLGDAIAAVAIVGGLLSFFLWVLSWWLLTRKRSMGVWFGGTISAVILPICFWLSEGGDARARNFLFVIGLFPSECIS